MKKIANFILVLAALMISATLFVQCNTECEECTASKLQPYINVKFINQDSLTKVTVLRNQTNSKINQNTVLRTRYSDSISAGNDNYIFKRDSVSEIIDSLQKEYTYFGAIVTKINNGSVKLDTVYGIGSDIPLLFINEKTGDTLTQFKFPLNPSADSSSFIIKIVDQKYFLKLSYQPKEYREVNKIKIGLFNPQLDSSSFTNSDIKCTFSKPECLSNETQLVLYF